MASKKRKEWKLPEEVNEVFAHAQAMAGLRDKYIEKVFGYRKAAKAAKEHRVLILKAWRMAREIHPDAPDALTWVADDGLLIETPKEATP